MHMKMNVCLLMALFAATVMGSPLSELVPEPQSLVATGGEASAAALAKVSVERGDVKGAKGWVADESYALTVTADGVKIVAGGVAGERNARTTLRQLVKLSGGKVPCCTIADGPVLKWRGFMVDTARNFLDVASIKDLIEVMAAYKLNLFHWHLTEYYGWRLQSKRHPELEKKGYFDPCGSRHHGKFYTQEEFKEVVSFAAAHGVTVMPEFDIPGHAEAFRRAFGFKSMRDPGVVDTLVDLVNELCALVPKETMPFVHLGGDEVWAEKEKFNPAARVAAAGTRPRKAHRGRDGHGLRDRGDAVHERRVVHARADEDSAAEGLEPRQDDVADAEGRRRLDAALGRHVHARRRDDGSSARDRRPRVFVRSEVNVRSLLE